MELPFLTADISPIPGRYRVQPEDFRVDEVLAYEPEGSGDHLFVRFEKQDLTTVEAVTRVAHALDVNANEVGWAGLKDRRAVTTQWASFFRGCPERARSLDVPGLRILDARRHPTKLRTGHLRGNRFRLILRDLPPDRMGDARTILEALETNGMPNYFGVQRFGIDGTNLERAKAWLVQGGRPPRSAFHRKLYVSTLQGSLFNDIVAGRVSAGLLGRAVMGDLMRKEDTGGLFVTDDIAEADRRTRNWEISPTGPMFGAKMRWPEQEARDREAAVLAQAGLTPEMLKRFRRAGQGTRRVVRVRPAEMTLDTTSDGFSLSFVLPKGSYATVLLRELFKAEPGECM